MQKKLKILFVTNNYTPYSGGVVNSINAFMQELRKQGHDVYIVTLDFLGDQHKDPGFVFRVPCPIKFLFKKKHFAVPLRVFNYMRNVVDDLKPDIIHSHHPFLLGRVAAKIAEKKSIPIIFTHHSLYDQWTHLVPLPSFLTQSVIKLYVKNYCDTVTGIIAPSSSVKDYLHQQGITTPITVNPSCIQDIFYPEKTFSLKEKSIKKPFHLLSVTRFSEEKNVPFLIDLLSVLIKQNIDCTMTLVGYGSLWEDMNNYASEQLKIPHEKITFIHKPSKETVEKIYQDADCFIFSSITDTQGLVLAEAMAAGTPVLALDGPGPRDIIINGKNGFIVHNQKEMISAIERVMYDESLFETMQYNAWKKSHDYKASVLSCKLLEFYNVMVKNHL